MSKNWCYRVKEGPHAGKLLWSGRYTATAGFIFVNMNSGWHVLASKRGKGTPDFQGKWNCPCGFLEADESGVQGCAREIFEETGLEINPNHLVLVGVETDPAKCNNGNVTIRYSTRLELGIDDTSFSMKAVLDGNGEKDEVEAIAWVKLTELDNYEWAFDHANRIREIADLWEIPYEIHDCSNQKVCE